MKIKILLSSYNGEKYIREQIDSLLAQTQPGIEILVRDDGSTDTSVKILKQYSSEGKLKYYAGENLGYARSFWTLICDGGDADYYAFCDQDDVWDRDKLEIAVRSLERLEASVPALYFSDVRVVDAELNTVCAHMVRPFPVDYPHSLVRNIAPGCTYVFNRSAVKILRKYNAERIGAGHHDWTVFRIIACFGQIIFDPGAHMSYRQHKDNCIGVNNDAKRYLKKIWLFLNGKMKCLRQDAARQMLDTYEQEMSSDNREITRLFCSYRGSLRSKAALIRCKELKFGGADRFFMNVLILMGRF